MKNKKLKNIAGVTLMELLVGIAVSALMMGAMFSTYSVVNNSYNQVTDRAKVSRSARDIVGMMVKDIRLAGFKYYYGDNDEGIAPSDDLTHISGLEEGRSLIDSHDPLIVERNILGYLPADTTEVVLADDEGASAEGATLDPNIANTEICCDRIHIVYGDFDKNDPKQKYKKYRITYYGMPMEDNSDDKLYAVYKTKESWIEHPDSPKGDWVSGGGQCSECYEGQLVRSHLVDMEFLLFDENGKHLFNTTERSYPNPLNPTTSVDLYRIRQVDLRLTFRSKKEFYRSKGTKEKPRLVKGLGDGRTQEFIDKYMRDSVVVSIYTRNIGIN